MRTTQKQFKLFQSECQKWIKRFELSGWRFDYFLKDIENQQGEVERYYENCVVAIRLNTKLFKSDGRSYTQVIKNTAKHEMIHILLGNLATMAYSKYVTEEEITKHEEELVRKLEIIIK